jgi:hypothetical protein
MINSVIGIRELHTAGFDDRGSSLTVRFTVDGLGNEEKGKVTRRKAKESMGKKEIETD